MRVVTVEIVAFLAQVILTVSTMIKGIVGVSAFNILIFAPGAAAIESRAFAVNCAVASARFSEFS